MKRILIPIDFTAISRDALYTALRLYGSEECQYILFNTYNIPYVGQEGPIVADDSFAQIAKESFSRLLKIVHSEFPKDQYKISTEFMFGPFISLVPQFVKDKKIDQIVMGTNEVSRLKEIMIGSRTSSIINSVRCPVLTVPTKWDFKIPKRVVFAIDSTTKLNKRTIQPLLDLIDQANADLMIFHMVSESEKMNSVDREIVNRLFEGLIFEYLVEVGDKAAPAIENFIANEDADLICTIKHDHNILKTIFHVSVTRKLSQHTAIPLLALHENIPTL